MNVEIAICTYNRAGQLKQTLGSLANAVVPDNVQLRVLVVNNNSNDDTDSVVQSFDRRELAVELLRESVQGHAVSRNRAIANCRGELLLWTDDDVLIDREWIAAFVDAARRQPQQSFWGGPIQPVFEPPQPKWISENWTKLSGCFAERDLGDRPRPLGPDELPYGANFAIRTDVQKRFLFDPAWGRRDSSVVGEDELELFRRLLHDQMTGGWVPAARVQHVIDLDRQTEAFVQSYFVGQGQALVRKGDQWTNDVRRLRRESRWERWCYRVKRHFAPSDTWVSHMIRSALAQGQLLALLERTGTDP